MKNSEIYRRTLKFSVMRLVRTILCVIMLVALPLITFVATGLAGLDEVVQLAATGVAFIVALIAFYLIAHYGGYLLTAGQVAMITEGVARASSRGHLRRGQACRQEPLCHGERLLRPVERHQGNHQRDFLRHERPGTRHRR